MTIRQLEHLRTPKGRTWHCSHAKLLQILKIGQVMFHFDGTDLTWDCDFGWMFCCCVYSHFDFFLGETHHEQTSVTAICNASLKSPAFGLDLPFATLYPSQTMIFGACDSPGISWKLERTRSKRSVLGLDGTGLVVMITVIECSISGEFDGSIGTGTCQNPVVIGWPSQAARIACRDEMLGGLHINSSTVSKVSMSCCMRLVFPEMPFTAKMQQPICNRFQGVRASEQASFQSSTSRYETS